MVQGISVWLWQAETGDGINPPNSKSNCRLKLTDDSPFKNSIFYMQNTFLENNKGIKSGSSRLEYVY